MSGGGRLATLLDAVAGDARLAVRTLLRRPGRSAASVVTLALGLGGTVAVVGAVRGILLRPLPYGDVDRIAVFWNQFDWSTPELEVVVERTRAFDAIAAITAVDWTMRRDDGSVLVPGLEATAALFDVLGARAAMGRTFAAGEDVPGSERVVVLSHALWRHELGGDPDVIGSTVVLDGTPRTVIGVMPAGFFFPTPQARFWAPLQLDPQRQAYGFLALLGRLRADVSPVAVAAELEAITSSLRERFQYSERWDKTQNAALTPVREVLLGDVERPLRLLAGAAAFLLLIACANVAALVLGRALERREELGVRAAMGARGGRLALQAVVDNFVVAGAGGVLGAVVGALGFDLVVRNLPVEAAWRDTLTPDWSLLGIGFIATLVAGLLVAFVGVYTVVRTDLRGALAGGGRRAGPGRGHARAQQALVVAEVMLAITLVAGAGLLLRSVAALRGLDTGVDPTGVLALDVVAGAGEFNGPERRALELRVLEAAQAVPGVQAAAITQRLPFRDGGWQGPYAPEDKPELSGRDAPNAYVRLVSPDYFRALGIGVLRGRTPTDADGASSAPVVVVNRALAERIWPGADPLGRRISTLVFSGVPRTIVGVVADVPVTALGQSADPILYVPLAQGPQIVVPNLIVRSSLDAAALAGHLRAVIRDLDPRLAVSRVQTLEDVIGQTIASPRRLTLFLELFAGLALALGAVGVYGVLSNFVGMRMPEFGVRLALGSTPARIISLVLRRATGLVAVGVALGITASLALSRIYRGLLFGVPAADPLTLLVATAILFGAAFAAAFIPARRAARVDPAGTLRGD